MEFDLSWILLGLPVAFVLGWLASRWDLRQIRAENRQAPKAYFKGLNFLLNEQQDKAIDAFIEAVQNDPDTSELHFALGNLFRRRGEYNRAVRVHEHLLSRGDLSRVDRDRAQHALAQDFLKAGLLDRAEDALRRLEGTAFEAEARLALLAIYERSRDWTQAAAIARRMQDANQGDFSGRLAHYLCEDAQSLLTQGQQAEALQRLQQAITTAPQAARPRLEHAQLQHRMGQSAQALQTLESLAEQSPAALPLAASCWWTSPPPQANASMSTSCSASNTPRHLRWTCCRRWLRWTLKLKNRAPMVKPRHRDAPAWSSIWTGNLPWWLLRSGWLARNCPRSNTTQPCNARWTTPPNR